MGTALTLFSDRDGKENKKQINEEEKKKKKIDGQAPCSIGGYVDLLQQRYPT